MSIAFQGLDDAEIDQFVSWLDILAKQKGAGGAEARECVSLDDAALKREVLKAEMEDNPIVMIKRNEWLEMKELMEGRRRRGSPRREF